MPTTRNREEPSISTFWDEIAPSPSPTPAPSLETTLERARGVLEEVEEEATDEDQQIERRQAFRDAINRMRSRPMPGTFGQRYGRTAPVNEESVIEVEEENRMPTVGEIARHHADVSPLHHHQMVVGSGRVGVELELENARGIRLEHWRTTTDNSLRDNGYEYILRQPLGGLGLWNAIVEIDRRMREISPDANWRCSTHVHLDVRDLTVPQFRKLILAYTILEKVIFKTSGYHRWTNNFCPSFGFAQAQIKELARLWSLEDETFIRRLDTSGRNGDRDKYSAFNFLPINRQGSVEFRGSEAKFTRGKLLRLCNRILSLRELAVSHEGSYQEFVDSFTNVHPSDVLLKSLPSKYDHDPADIEEGICLANDILHLGNLLAGEIPMIRPRWPENWESELNMRMPERIRADELHRLTAQQGRWAGDFVHGSSWEDFTNWCETNGLSL